MSSKGKKDKPPDPKKKEDEAAVGAVGGADGETNYGLTMRALLHQYTQTHTLTEVDEDGEHPLFPRPRGRGEQRTAGVGDGHSTVAGDAESSAKEQILISQILRGIDTERLTHVKELFMQKDNELDSKDFVDVLFGNVRSLEGGEDRLIDGLELLHARLAQEREEDKVDENDDSKDAHDSTEKPAFLTEGNQGEEDGARRIVTWNLFAKFLLDEGVVSDVIASFKISQVLSLIDLDKIAPLQDTFKKKGHLNLEDFVIIMKSQFQHVFELTTLFDLHEEERKLIAQLINLYEMIDVAGKESMTWEEFTAFLVDQGMAEDVPQQYNTIRFSQSPLRDDTVHQSHCEMAIYFKGYDKIAFVEQGSKSLKMCTPDMVNYAEVKDFTQTPLCAEYIDKYSYVVVSCSDLSLSFFDVDNNLKLARRIETNTAQLVLCWSQVAEVLFSADHEGKILAWDLSRIKAGPDREASKGDAGRDGKPALPKLAGDPDAPHEWRKFVKAEIAKQDPPMRHIDIDSQREEFFGHSSHQEVRRKAKATPRNGTGQTIVMMLLELPALQQLASCGVDRNIMTWDVFTGTYRRTLRGHEMGVRCMAFATSTKVLVSGGYDYTLFVWNPYVGKYIHTIQGHSAPIVGLEVLGSPSNQVVSADSDGYIKTWDLGTYQCLQTLFVDQVLTLRALISTPSHKRIFAVDRTFIAYDYENTGKPDQTEEDPLIKAFYHPKMRVFVTGTVNHVKVWDAATGGIRVIITHSETEITDFCFDDRGRKIFVSDNRGDTYVYHSSTGCQVKKLTPHSKEVSGMIYCPGDKNIITVSWDRSIVVHDDAEQSPKIRRKSTNAHKGDITCIAYSRHLGLIATGSTDCVIAVREYLRLRILSFLLGHKTDITAMAFVEPYPLLVSADFSGNVAIWALPTVSGKQHKHANSVLTRFINMQSLESSASVNCVDPVCEAREGAPRFSLYTGDEDGDVRVWDLAPLLQAAEIEPCQPIPESEWDPCKKVETDASHTTETMARRAASLDVPELQALIDKPVVRQGTSWKAHHDSMRTLKVYNDPQFILTAGYDGMVKIWGWDGQLMTVLRAYGSTPWNFQVNHDDAGVDIETLDHILSKVHEADKNRVSDTTLLPKFTMPGLSPRAEDSLTGYKSKKTK